MTLLVAKVPITAIAVPVINTTEKEREVVSSVGKVPIGLPVEKERLSLKSC